VIGQWQLRAAFAARLSDMYGQEVPAYTTLVDVSREVNEDVLRAQGADAERLGSISRVTAERHGAIRVGTPTELRQVARVFGALGMHPVGFYDLREAAAGAVPVVSTAFRPWGSSRSASARSARASSSGGNSSRPAGNVSRRARRSASKNRGSAGVSMEVKTRKGLRASSVPSTELQLDGPLRTH
jgi:hypothetical protein